MFNTEISFLIAYTLGGVGMAIFVELGEREVKTWIRLLINIIIYMIGLSIVKVILGG